MTRPEDSWRNHARLGVQLSAFVLADITLYAALGVSAHARPLLMIAVAGTIVTLAATALAPYCLRRPWVHRYFYLWSAAASVVILGGCAVDGGDSSPITAALFLPLLFAALTYPPAAVLFVGAVDVAGFAVVAVADSTPSVASTFVVASMLTAAALMSAMAALSRGRQQQVVQELLARLEDESTHDALTNSVNRRAFDAAIAREVATAARHRTPLALLLVDVDFLKQVNDNLGHAAGDQALVLVARTLRSESRRTDIVARVGGDEFAVIAPLTSARGAAEVAARVRRRLHETRGAVTVSVGIADVAPDCHVDELVRRADVALYAAKQAGRDCTRIWSGADTDGTPVTPSGGDLTQLARVAGH